LKIKNALITAWWLLALVVVVLFTAIRWFYMELTTFAMVFTVAAAIVVYIWLMGGFG